MSQLGIYRFKVWRYACNMHESDILDFVIKSTLCNNTMLRQITESVCLVMRPKKYRTSSLGQNTIYFRVLRAVVMELCMVQFHLLPSPPGQPRGQVQPFGPGGGELLEAVLSRGEGGGANRK